VLQPSSSEEIMTTTNTQNATLPRSKQAPIDRLLDRDVQRERTLSHGAPSKPLLGALPLARLIPQDLHSVMDYANGAATGSGALMAEDRSACLASIVLGAGVVGISAITDYRLSLAKIVPIEVHEIADYAWGAAAIAAPFVLGYWKREPRVALMHVISGAGTILASMFTDYRSAKRRR
jgi:hypothetical protein